MFFLISLSNKFSDWDKSYTVENKEVLSASNLTDVSKDYLCILRKEVILMMTLNKDHIVLVPIWDVGH